MGFRTYPVPPLCPKLVLRMETTQSAWQCWLIMLVMCAGEFYKEQQLHVKEDVSPEPTPLVQAVRSSSLPLLGELISRSTWTV